MKQTKINIKEKGEKREKKEKAITRKRQKPCEAQTEILFWGP